jgi:hypothetical protein
MLEVPGANHKSLLISRSVIVDWLLIGDWRLLTESDNRPIGVARAINNQQSAINT